MRKDRNIAKLERDAEIIIKGAFNQFIDVNVSALQTNDGLYSKKINVRLYQSNVDFLDISNLELEKIEDIYNVVEEIFLSLKNKNYFVYQASIAEKCIATLIKQYNCKNMYAFTGDLHILESDEDPISINSVIINNQYTDENKVIIIDKFYNEYIIDFESDTVIACETRHFEGIKPIDYEKIN